MRVRLAEQILTMFGFKGGKPDQYGSTHTSDQYQLMYKAAEMILKDASDGDIVRICKERDIMDVPRCRTCGKKMEDTYSFNGVLDSWTCPDEGYTGKHKPVKKKGLLKRVLGRT